MEKRFYSFIRFVNSHAWIAYIWVTLWSIALAVVVFNYNFTTSI